MPVGAVIGYLGVFLGEQRFEERQLMQADDDGMLEQFVKLEGIKEPRMLSWAEERALRRDLADGARAVLNGQWRRSRCAEEFWPKVFSGWERALMNKMTTAEWRAQYLQTPKPQEWCRCENKRVASCVKPLRIGHERYFQCYTCHLPIFGDERY